MSGPGLCLQHFIITGTRITIGYYSCQRFAITYSLFVNTGCKVRYIRFMTPECKGGSGAASVQKGLQRLHIYSKACRQPFQYATYGRSVGCAEYGQPELSSYFRQHLFFPPA